jgi:hypothetical protein
VGTIFTKRYGRKLIFKRKRKSSVRLFPFITSGGIPGYRMMQKLLIPHGFDLSKVTIHKYTKELGLKSMIRRKKPGYRKGPVRKVGSNP